MKDDIYIDEAYFKDIPGGGKIPGTIALFCPGRDQDPVRSGRLWQGFIFWGKAKRSRAKGSVFLKGSKEMGKDKGSANPGNGLILFGLAVTAGAPPWIFPRKIPHASLWVHLTGFLIWPSMVLIKEEFSESP